MTPAATSAPHRTPATIWSSTLGQLEMIVTRANFDTWLRDTIGLRHEDGRFVIGAQTDFATEWLATRLRPLITKTLARVLGHPIDVGFEVVRLEAPEQPVLLSQPEGAAEPSAVQRSVAPPALNPSLTFDSFVVGDENRLAFESARKALAEPGRMNPLTIFGASGLGKTHLLNAIGHAAYEQRLNVVYAPAERFGNDFVRSLTSGVEAFRRRYRTVDVLLLDDVQFFEGKAKFQDEFFHTFNDLHSAGKQIIVSCDRMPAQATGLADALRSRLQWGLMVDLQKPSFETRLAILRSKARIHALRLPDRALEVIAERGCPTVRELEGYLNRVLAYVPLVGGDVTPDVIEKALTPLSPSVPHEDTPTAPDAIIDAVCRRTGVTPTDLRGRSRARDVSYARHLAMYLMKEDGRRTIAEIGRAFGNRDHSTVLAAVQRISIEKTTRPETAADLTATRATATTAPAATLAS